MDTFCPDIQFNFMGDSTYFIIMTTVVHYEEGRIGVLIPRNGKLTDPTYETTIMHPLLPADDGHLLL